MSHESKYLNNIMYALIIKEASNEFGFNDIKKKLKEKQGTTISNKNSYMYLLDDFLRKKLKINKDIKFDKENSYVNYAANYNRKVLSDAFKNQIISSFNKKYNPPLSEDEKTYIHYKSASVFMDKIKSTIERFHKTLPKNADVNLKTVFQYLYNKYLGEDLIKAKEEANKKISELMKKYGLKPQQQDTTQEVSDNEGISTTTPKKNSKVDNMLGTILGGAVKLVGGIASIAKLKTLSDRINEVGERIAGSEYLRKMCFGLRKYLLVLIYGAIWFGGGKQYLRRKAQENAASGIAPENYGANAAAIQTVAGEPVSTAESTDYLYLNTFLDTLMMINEAEEAIAPTKNSRNVSNPLGINLNDNNEKLTSSMVSRSYVISTKLMNDNEFISLINKVDPQAFITIKGVAEEAQMNKGNNNNKKEVTEPQTV